LGLFHRENITADHGNFYGLAETHHSKAKGKSKFEKCERVMERRGVLHF
jgi:hypothetical protein